MSTVSATARPVIDYVELPASDVARSKRFYSQVFGWSYKDWGPEYADTGDSGVSSGLNADGAHRTRAPLAVIHVSHLEEAEARVRAEGGRITRAIFAFPGGRRFHFVDTEGNELAVWGE